MAELTYWECSNLEHFLENPSIGTKAKEDITDTAHMLVKMIRGELTILNV